MRESSLKFKINFPNLSLFLRFKAAKRLLIYMVVVLSKSEVKVCQPCVSKIGWFRLVGCSIKLSFSISGDRYQSRTCCFIFLFSQYFATKNIKI